MLALVLTWASLIIINHEEQNVTLTIKVKGKGHKQNHRNDYFSQMWGVRN